MILVTCRSIAIEKLRKALVFTKYDQAWWTGTQHLDHGLASSSESKQAGQQHCAADMVAVDSPSKNMVTEE